MHKKTTIIFDCFGVICTTPFETWFRTNLGDWEVSKHYFFEFARRFDLGEIDEGGAFIELAGKVSRTPAEIKKEIDGLFGVNHELTDYIKELKDRGYKIGFISNGHQASLERRLFSQYEWFKPLFHSLIISSEVGMVKPEPGIYTYALQKLGSEPSECVFVDDVEKNIVGAEAVGITGLVYTSVSKLKEDLHALGI